MPADPDFWPEGVTLPLDLLAAKMRVYDPCGFACSRPVPEPESAAYGAHEFTVAGRRIRFRVARTTPKKAGQFVTLWKRSERGPIAPFDVDDPIDLVVVAVRDGEHVGQFVFPRAVLAERGVFSRGGAGGKRAIRVYPPWAVTTSRQAGGTQAWQGEHFLSIPSTGAVDTDRVRALYLE